MAGDKDDPMYDYLLVSVVHLTLRLSDDDKRLLIMFFVLTKKNEKSSNNSFSIRNQLESEK